MASSSSITQSLLLLNNCCKPSNLSPLSARSLHSSTTPTTNSIFTKPVRFPYRATVSPIAARFGNSTPARNLDQSNIPNHLLYMFERFKFEKNPYLTTGPEKFCNVQEDEDALYVRLDMPGIENKGLKLRVENGILWILGDEFASRSLHKLEEDRIYCTNISVPSEMYRTDQIRALLKNGVLRVVIPKVKNGEITGSAHSITVENLPLQRRSVHLSVSGHDNFTTPGQKFTPDFEKATRQYIESVHLLRENPFLVKGPVAPFKIISGFSNFKCTRWDMPGVGIDGVKLWIEDGYLCFEGVEDDKSVSYDKEIDRRKYEGCYRLSEMFVRDDIAACCFENGVLRVSMVEEMDKRMLESLIKKVSGS